MKDERRCADEQLKNKKFINTVIFLLSVSGNYIAVVNYKYLKKIKNEMRLNL